MKIVPQTKEPGPRILSQLMSATHETIKSVNSHAESLAGDDEFGIHVLGVMEGTKALAWLSLGLVWSESRTPKDYVKECIDMCQREYFDGIIEEFQDRPKHIEWCTAFVDCLQELLAYITQWHAYEPGWGPKSRSMTFWSNAIAQTSPGEGAADAYEYSTKLGMPVSKEDDCDVDINREFKDQFHENPDDMEEAKA